MSIEKNDNSAMKILKAAEEVFAEKGFDGARVDEIAKRAGVNKALIYYYFESKEKILEELSKKHLQEIIDTKEDLLNKANIEQGINHDNFKEIIEPLWNILAERKDFLNIILIETLKNQNGNDYLFTLVNELLGDALIRFEKIGYHIDQDKFKALAFFYGYIPISFYIVIWEKWAEFNNIDKEKLKATITEAVTDLEFSLFLNKFNIEIDKKTLNSLSRLKHPDQS